MWGEHIEKQVCLLKTETRQKYTIRSVGILNEEHGEEVI